MEWVEFSKWIVTGISTVAACLAWIAKIRWSKEYSAAKEETIRSKEATIEYLERLLGEYRELTPMRLREYQKSTIEGYEEILSDKEAKITCLLDTGSAEMTADLKSKSEEIQALRKELDIARNRQSEADSIYARVASVLRGQEGSAVEFRTPTSSGYIQLGEKRFYNGEFIVIKGGQLSDGLSTGYKAYSFGDVVSRARTKCADRAAGRPYLFFITENDGGLSYKTAFSLTGEKRQSATVSFPSKGEWIMGGAGSDRTFEIVIQPFDN